MVREGPCAQHLPVCLPSMLCAFSCITIKAGMQVDEGQGMQLEIDDELIDDNMAQILANPEVSSPSGASVHLHCMPFSAAKESQ